MGIAVVHPEKEYLGFLAEGRFLIPRSRSSGRFVFFPRIAEPRSGATDLEWTEVSGRGSVYSTTVMRRKPPAPNVNLALIDLEEGPRMMSRVEGIAPEAVTIGMKVKARIVCERDAAIVVFVPEEIAK